jgi:hypothetical protein
MGGGLPARPGRGERGKDAGGDVAVPINLCNRRIRELNGVPFSTSFSSAPSLVASSIGAISRSSVGLVIFWSVFRTSGASRSSLAMAAPSVAFSAATSGFGGRLALCSSKSPAFIGRTIGALTGSPAASVSKATNSALYWTVTSRADRGAPPRTNSGANAMFRRRTALSSLYRSSAPGRWMPKGVAFHHVVAEVGSGAIPNGGSFDGQLAGCMGRGCPQP